MYERLEFSTRGRGLLEITEQVRGVVSTSGVRAGLCQVCILHTSASLVVTENADRDVQRDLETFMSRLAPDGDPAWRHDAEGPDDMPAHLRSVLTQTSLGLPIIDGQVVLGTWQGIFLWEHRARPHARTVIVTVIAA